jgi:membrane protein
VNRRSLADFDLQREGKRLKRLSRHVWTHFQEDRCLEEAASLGYTSLLAMVPLLAVIFGIITAFPVFNEVSAKLQEFIFANIMPAAGEQIQPYLETFLSSVRGLTLPGTITLIVTALLLMFRIEVALNRIWRVENPRTLTNRIVMYWAVLTLGPMLIGAAIALSAQKILMTLGLDNGVDPGLQRVGIFFLYWAVFTLFFILVPNRRVKFRDALAGAFLSAVLFELAKVGFVAYVSNANYSKIYGALATIPIFLFWLYIVWALVLFGASLAASLTTFSERANLGDWPDKWSFQLVYRLVGHLWKAQRVGQAVPMIQLLELEPRATERQILDLLHHLQGERIVTCNREDNWMLARDLEDISLADLYHSGHYYLPLADDPVLPSDSEMDRVFHRSLAEVRSSADPVLSRPLRNMYRESVEISAEKVANEEKTDHEK